VTEDEALRRVHVAGLGHHLHVLLRLEQQAQAVANDRVVVGEDDRDLGLVAVHGCGAGGQGRLPAPAA
jgi:hypothetical protein